MRLLVTGAAGMVGRNLLDHPASRQYEILCPTRAELDLTHKPSVSAFLQEKKPDTIIHLAAVVGGIQANIDEPARFLSANVEMATNLFTCAHDQRVRNILNIASSCMYPRNIDRPLTTDMILSAPLEPTNEGYALAKILSMRLLEYLTRQDERLCYRTIIPCNLYGLYDHFDPIKSHLVPAAIMKVVAAHDQSAPSVPVWGDGSARREFMFAADLADFIWWALPQLDKLPPALNVGTGLDHTVAEHYQAISELVGYRGELAFDSSKPAGMMRKLLNVSTVDQLGWRAPTSLRDGLAKTIEHYRTIIPNS